MQRRPKVRSRVSLSNSQMITKSHHIPKMTYVILRRQRQIQLWSPHAKALPLRFISARWHTCTWTPMRQTYWSSRPTWILWSRKTYSCYRDYMSLTLLKNSFLLHLHPTAFLSQMRFFFNIVISHLILFYVDTRQLTCSYLNRTFYVLWQRSVSTSELPRPCCHTLQCKSKWKKVLDQTMIYCRSAK